jgi:hypothetical protein
MGHDSESDEICVAIIYCSAEVRVHQQTSTAFCFQAETEFVIGNEMPHIAVHTNVITHS